MKTTIYLPVVLTPPFNMYAVSDESNVYRLFVYVDVVFILWSMTTPIGLLSPNFSMIWREVPVKTIR